jgi:hypothetical protein
MGSKASRQKGRRKRKKHGRRWQGFSADVHVDAIVGTLSNLAQLMVKTASGPDPLATVTERIDNIIETLRTELATVEPMSAIEVIRMICLPFSPRPDTPPAGAQDGPAIAEVLGLAAVTASAETDPAALSPVEQGTGQLISETLVPLVRELLDLASVQDLLAATQMDPIEQVAAAIRGAGRQLRSTSYADMQESALTGLFGTSTMDGLLRSQVEFTVADAISVLNACHDLQMESFNRRGQGLADAFNSIDMTPGARRPRQNGGGRKRL